MKKAIRYCITDGNFFLTGNPMDIKSEDLRMAKLYNAKNFAQAYLNRLKQTNARMKAEFSNFAVTPVTLIVK